MFEYISSVDIQINIPETVMSWAVNYPYKNVPENNPQIQRQIIRLYYRNLTDKDFPIKLIYKDDEFDLTFELYTTLKNKFFKDLKSIGLPDISKYSRILLPDTLNQEVVDCLPGLLQQYDPLPILQIVDGHGMLPHTDFKRKSSLFRLLTEPDDCVTLWYESNDGTKLHDEMAKYGFIYASGDLDRLELKKSFVIEKNLWYVFDNYSYHAVKANKPIFRKCLLIEFADTWAADLYDMIQSSDARTWL